MTTNFFFLTPLFCCCFWIRDPRSGIRDPGSRMGKNLDPGSGINIPDPQHCRYPSKEYNTRLSQNLFIGVRGKVDTASSNCDIFGKLTKRQKEQPTHHCPPKKVLRNLYLKHIRAIKSCPFSLKDI